MAKLVTGKVSSVATDKTIVVVVQTRRTHPIYKKQYSVKSKFMAHDEKNECRVGDTVSIKETRPISARKHFTLVQIIDRPLIGEADKVNSLDTTENTEKKQ